MSQLSPSLFYDSQESNTANCDSSTLPPEQISDYRVSLNNMLGTVELQKGNQLAENPHAAKILDKFFEAGDNQAFAHKNAVGVAAYIAAQKFSGDQKSYSFALGAASQVANNSPLITMIESLLGLTLNSEINKGEKYARDVYLKDSNRHNVQDSCNRVAESEKEPLPYPHCTVSERHFRFSGMANGTARVEGNIFNYGENVNLTFTVDTITIRDDFRLVAVGGTKNSAQRMYEMTFYQGVHTFFINNYSTKESGGMYMWAKAREASTNGSAVEITIKCTPALLGSNSVNKGDFTRPPVEITPVGPEVM